MTRRTIKEELQNVKKGWDLLVDQRSSAAIDGLEGDNSIIHKGEKSLIRLEELIEDHESVAQELLEICGRAIPDPSDENRLEAITQSFK